MVKILSVFFGITMLLSVSCKGPLSAPEGGAMKPGTHKGVINEVIQAGEYTYLNVKEKRSEVWIAVPGMVAEKGDKVSFEGDGLEMKEFHSKELNRTFSSVLFLQGVTLESGKSSGAVANAPHVAEVRKEKINVSIEPGAGCISIAKLYADKTSYSGKLVKVKGKVTKFNPEIMGKNWIHLQDGTDFNGSFDLTVTTDQVVAIGDTIVIEGKIALNKDFGYGYFYDILIEDAKVVE